MAKKPKEKLRKKDFSKRAWEIERKVIGWQVFARCLKELGATPYEFGSYDFIEGIRRGFKKPADTLSAALPEKAASHYELLTTLTQHLTQAQLKARDIEIPSEQIGWGIFMFCVETLIQAQNTRHLLCDKDSFTIIEETFEHEMAGLLVELGLIKK